MNDILKYTSKDYNSILADLKDSIPSLTDLWTNTNDGDPGIVLVKLMSALGDMLSFNLDKQALEFYSSTVTQRKNAAKLFNLIGYRMKWYRSATNRITVTNTTTKSPLGQLVVAYDNWYNIPTSQPLEKEAAWIAYTNIRDNVFKPVYPYNSYPQYYIDANTLKPDAELYAITNTEYQVWRADNAIKIYPYLTYDNRNLALFTNSYDNIPYTILPQSIRTADPNNNSTILPYYVILPDDSTNIDIVQGSLHSIQFSSRQLQNNRFYFTESAIDETNMWLAYTTSDTPTPLSYNFIDKVENLLTTDDGDIHFEFNVDEYDRPYIELSSYWKSKRDSSGSVIIADSAIFTIFFLRTAGSLGNITSNYITNIEGIASRNYTITHPTNVTPYYDEVTGDLIAIPGKHPELPHEAYVNSLNWVTTFNTLVTLFDFERFCKRQEGFTNAFAVDKQRAIDLNNLTDATCGSYKAYQLRAFADLSSEGGSATTIEELRALYNNHKKVTYEDGVLNPDAENDYKPYQLQLHLIYGSFALKQRPTDTQPIATMQVVKKSSATSKSSYWLYQMIDWGEDIDNDNGPQDPENIGSPIYYLKRAYTDLRVANVLPAYSPVRVFPWRCCGTIHLKAPVTSLVAESIIQTVIDHLTQAFSPKNLEFGQPINYMDVINVVTNAHESIRYFDAGLGNRKLIDIDDSIDFTYFNPTSMMYYIQRQNTGTINLTNSSSSQFICWGNNVEYQDNANTVPNPYYQLLSIAPEYIVD